MSDLDARLDRLRERLRSGDPDLTPDELQAAIERVESKRRELAGLNNLDRESARILTVLPKEMVHGPYTEW